MDEKTTVGIAGVGSYLPRRAVDAWEAVQSSGIPRAKFDAIGVKRLHLAGDGEKPSDMAAVASRRALADAGLRAEQVDLVIYAGSHKDHTRWMASAKLQADLGCGTSYCFDLHQGCNGQNMAMNVARAQMFADPDVDTVLIAAAERWDATLELPVLGHAFVFGDGGSAAVLRRGHESRVILSTTCRTWGEHHQTFCCPELGAATRLTPEVLERGGHLFQMYRPLHTDREAVKAFGAKVNQVAQKMIEKATVRAEVSMNDIDVVITINASKRHNELFLEAVGLADRRNTAHYGDETGHLGTGDIFYNLERARDEELIRPGDLVAFYTGGGGFSWAVTLIRI